MVHFCFWKLAIDDFYGFPHLIDVKKRLPHSGIIDFEFFGIRTILNVIILSQNKGNLRYNLFCCKITALFERAGGTKLTTYWAPTHCRNTDHPTLSTTTQPLINKSILFFAYGIFCVKRKKGICYFNWVAIFCG